jgi:hypothetical protein
VQVVDTDPNINISIDLQYLVHILPIPFIEMAEMGDLNALVEARWGVYRWCRGCCCEGIVATAAAAAAEGDLRMPT